MKTLQNETKHVTVEGVEPWEKVMTSEQVSFLLLWILVYRLSPDVTSWGGQDLHRKPQVYWFEEPQSRVQSNDPV